MQIEARMNHNSVIDKEYSFQQNNTLVTSLPPLIVHGSEYLLTLMEDSLSIRPVIYTIAGLILLAVWYFLFWRPFDWIRVNESMCRRSKALPLHKIFIFFIDTRNIKVRLFISRLGLF